MSSGFNMVDDLTRIETVNRTQSATRREAELVTNIVDQPTTWGSSLPNTAGRVRVQGAQIWVSAFVRTADVYDVQTKKTVFIPGYYRPIADGSVSRADDYIEYPTINETVVANATTQYSISFSFGYNIAPQYARKLSKLWINGVLAYDFVANVGTEKYQFEFFPNGGQSKTMVESMGAENAPYFPNQSYIVIRGLKLEDTNNIPVSTVSAEFTIEGVANGTLTYSDAAGWPEGGQYAGTYIDFDRRVAFTYINPYDIYRYGRIVQWSIDNGQLLTVIDVKLLAPKGTKVPSHEPIPSRGVVWLPKAQTIVYSGASSQNNSCFYAMNVATGEILSSRDPEDTWIFSNTSGGMTHDNVEGAGSGFLWLGAIGNAYYVVNVSDYGRTLSVAFVSAGDVNTFTAIGGSDHRGFAVLASGTDLYRITPTGVVKQRTLPFEPRSIGAYGGHLWLFAGNRVHRQTYGGQAIYTVVSPAYETVPPGGDAFANSDVSGGTFGWVYGSGQTLVLNMASGSVQAFTGSGAAFAGWDSQRGQGVSGPSTGDRRSSAFLPALGVGGSIKLRDVIRGLYQFAGQDPARLQFLDIDDDVPGCFIFGQQPLNDIVQNLMRLFRINRIDRATGTTFYRNRPLTGTVTPDGTIDVDDLMYVDDSDDKRTKIKFERASPNALADIVELKFIDPENDYVVNTLSWTRPDASLSTSNKLDVSVPLVLTKQQALEIVRNGFNDQNASGIRNNIRLPPALSMYESGDILAITSGPYVDAGDGRVRRQFLDIVQIEEDTHNADDSVDCICVNVVSTSSETFKLPTTPGTDSKTLANLRAQTRCLVIDSTSLTFYDDPLRDDGYVQYATLFPKIPQEDWPGGYASRKRIGANEDWRKLFEIPKGKSDVIVFRAQSVLGDIRFQTDDTPLKLLPLYGTWKTKGNTTRSVLYNDIRKNLAFYGRPGAWELVQFEKIEDNVCTGIMRGRRGTEQFCGTHNISDYFVIAGAYLLAEQRGLSLRGTEQYKGVALSQTFASVGADDVVTPQGNSAKPWAVAAVKAKRQGDDIVLSWIRRDRVYRNWGRPITEKLNSESIEKYEIDIINPTDGKVIRTVHDIMTPSYTYTAADQTADFGASVTSRLTLMVVQVGAHVGRGFGEKVTIDVG